MRDIIAMGAKPVALMDSLRFGAASDPDTQRVADGVVSGISFYGNCLGVPNIGGETAFDPVYQGNPLVNVLCVGVMRRENIRLANASGPGNLVVLFGAPREEMALAALRSSPQILLHPMPKLIGRPYKLEIRL